MLSRVRERTKNVFRVTINTVRLILNFSLEDEDEVAWREQQWVTVEPFVKARFGDAESQKCRDRYLSDSSLLRYIDLRSDAIQHRWIATVAVIGTVLYFIALAELLPTLDLAPVRTWVMFAALFVVNAAVVSYGAPFYYRPWRRLAWLTAISTIVGLATSSAILGSPLPLPLGHGPGGEFTLSVFFVAGYDLWSVLLTLIFLPIANSRALANWSSSAFASQRENNRAVELTSSFAEDDTLRLAQNRNQARLELRQLARYVEYELPGVRPIRRDVQERHEGAARRLRELETWVQLPQEGTRQELFNAVGDFTAVLLLSQRLTAQKSSQKVTTSRLDVRLCDLQSWPVYR